MFDFNYFRGFQAILIVLAVRAMFFKLEWCRNHPKIWSGGQFLNILEVIICAETFVILNYVFNMNYSKRLRWPPIDLRRGVHLKHQNLISKFEKNRKNQRRFPYDFTLCLRDSILTVNMHRKCVRKTSFEKCTHKLTTSWMQLQKAWTTHQTHYKLHYKLTTNCTTPTKTPFEKLDAPWSLAIAPEAYPPPRDGCQPQ